MRLANNALDTASVQGRTQLLRRKRQHASASANGSPVGKLELGGTTRAEAHATTTEQQFGDDFQPPQCEVVISPRND